MSDGSFETHAKYSINYWHVCIARVEWHGIYESSRQVKKKKTRVLSGFSRVNWVPGRLTGSNQVFILNSFLFYLDRSSHRVTESWVNPPGRSGFNNYVKNKEMKGSGVWSCLREVLNWRVAFCAGWREWILD